MPSMNELSFLIVDDEPFFVVLLEQYLNKLGVREINVVPDGPRAIEFIDRQGQGPDIVLLDMTMPEMSGGQVLGELAAREFSGIVVLVSGADPETLEYAKGFANSRDVRVPGYIQKPLSFKQLKTAFAEMGIGAA